MFYVFDEFKLSPYVDNDGEAKVKISTLGNDVCFLVCRVRKVPRKLNPEKTSVHTSHTRKKPTYNYSFVVVEDSMSKDKFAMATSTFVRNIDAVMKGVKVKVEQSLANVK